MSNCTTVVISVDFLLQVMCLHAVAGYKLVAVFTTVYSFVTLYLKLSIGKTILPSFFKKVRRNLVNLGRKYLSHKGF
tara:strand:- start:2005 stop:2235 length:231 start_codon:yes stop_codon:yes gene_type:complete